MAVFLMKLAVNKNQFSVLVIVISRQHISLFFWNINMTIWYLTTILTPFNYLEPEIINYGLVNLIWVINNKFIWFSKTEWRLSFCCFVSFPWPFLRIVRSLKTFQFSTKGLRDTQPHTFFRYISSLFRILIIGGNSELWLSHLIV